MKRHIIHMQVDSLDGPSTEEIDLDELPLERIFGMLQLMPSLSSYYDERMAKGLIDKGDPQLMTDENAYPLGAYFLTSGEDDLDQAARNVRQLSFDIPNRIRFKKIPFSAIGDFEMYHVAPSDLNDDDLCIEIIAQIILFMQLRNPGTLEPFDRLVLLHQEFANRQTGLTHTIPGLVFDIKTLDYQELEKRANRAIELAKIYNFNSEKGWALIEFITSTWPDDLVAELAILVFRASGFSQIHEPKILAQMVFDRVNNRRSHY